MILMMPTTTKRRSAHGAAAGITVLRANIRITRPSVLLIGGLRSSDGESVEENTLLSFQRVLARATRARSTCAGGIRNTQKTRSKQCARSTWAGGTQRSRSKICAGGTQWSRSKIWAEREEHLRCIAGLNGTVLSRHCSQWNRSEQTALRLEPLTWNVRTMQK